MGLLFKTEENGGYFIVTLSFPAKTAASDNAKNGDDANEV